MSDSDDESVNSWFAKNRRSSHKMNQSTSTRNDDDNDLSGDEISKLQRKLKSTPSRRSFLFNDTDNTSKLLEADLAETDIKIQRDRHRAKLKQRLESRLRQRFESDWVLASSEDDEFAEVLEGSSEDSGMDNRNPDNHINDNYHDDNQKQDNAFKRQNTYGIDDEDLDYTNFNDDDDDDVDDDDKMVKVNVKNKKNVRSITKRVFKNRYIKVGQSGKTKTVLSSKKTRKITTSSKKTRIFKNENNK